MNYVIAHSAKGTTWKNHKYVTKIGNRYVYKDDEKRRRDKISAEYKGDKKTMKSIDADQKLADMDRPLSAELQKNGLQAWSNILSALGVAGKGIKDFVTPDSVAVNNAKRKILNMETQQHNSDKLKGNISDDITKLKARQSAIQRKSEANKAKAIQNRTNAEKAERQKKINRASSIKSWTISNLNTNKRNIYSMAKSSISKTSTAGSKLVNKKPKTLVSPSMQSYVENEEKKKRDKKNRQTNLRMRLTAGKQKA